MNATTPTREEISLRAWSIWQAHGCPTGRDEEFWFEAERELTTPTSADNVPSATDGRGNGNSQGKRKTEADPTPKDLKPTSDSDRLRGEMASESEVEYHISPPVSDAEAIKSALQTRDARAPQRPTKQAPKAKPPESGKPIWKKPHSS